MIPDRDLLIALNASPALSRAAACRLGSTLAEWALPSLARSLANSAPPEPPPGLSAALGLPRAALERALALLPSVPRLAEAQRRAAAELGGHLLARADPGYPGSLLQLALPPPVLYVQGALPDVLASSVAIVGSRKADAYGLEAAALFAGGLAAAGVPVISGFARGIDAAAHRAALAAGGPTVAVLGCGLGVDYPRGHRALGAEIAQGGCLLTEFPCGMVPRTWHFPVRNRLIAALAEGGVLVIQAALRSGSLSTARHALDLGREIFALPGRIFDERSLGTHALIREGAQLVQHPQDVLDTLRLPLRLPEMSEPPEEKEEEAGSPTPETALLRLLGRGLLPAEDLADALELPLDRVLGLLLELELDGRVRRHPGSVYGRG